MSDVHKEIGNLIRQYREKKGLTQLELAQKLGLQTPQFISVFERGISKVPIETIGELCLILGLPGEKIQDMLVRSAEDEIAKKIQSGKSNQRKRKYS